MDTSPDVPPWIVTGRLDGPVPRHGSAVLQYFHRCSVEVATVDDLGAFVRERDPSDDDPSRVAIRLHHGTLPKLAAYGLVEYDPRTKTARYRGRQPTYE